MALSLVAGIPAAIAFTPDQELVVLGQHVSVGARAPSLSLSGPAQLVQIGNTELDVPHLTVHGPLRPRLTMGPVQRNDAAAEVLDPRTSRQAGAEAGSKLRRGFLQWYLWAGLGLLAVALALCAIAGCVRTLVLLRGQSGRPGAMTVLEIRHRAVSMVGRMTVLAVLTATLGWALSGLLAYSGTARGLGDIDSLTELVGTSYVSPSPVGPPIEGYLGAVIGDSRAARVGGPPVADASAADAACGRSSDSLAAEVGTLLSAPVLNLACSGATLARGLRGPQSRAGQVLAPQVGRLKQVRDLRFVVVVVGPNDVGWSDFLTYCYGVENCTDRLTEGEFGYRLSRFDRAYGDLLRDLNELPSRPRVVVVTSYDLFGPGSQCPQTDGPPRAAGITPTEIALLRERNARLNQVLVDGARKYRFGVAVPALAPLCRPSGDGLGPDLQGFGDPHPFHPTGIGSVRMAASVARLLEPNRDG